MPRPLPLAVTSLPELLKGGYVYVDKTRHAYNLITGGKRYFLCRPRRFGKTLFLSTLQEILEGNKELFNDLWIGHSDYTWHKHAVISLDFSNLDCTSKESFEDDIINELELIASKNGLDLKPAVRSSSVVLKTLCRELHKKYGQVALLIDEYDRPLLRHMNNPETTDTLRQTLDQFFLTIKAQRTEISFAILTGVLPMSVAGIYSGLNDLTRISLEPKYGDICGYTHNELNMYFDEHVKTWANEKEVTYTSLITMLKKWYNGYHFGKNTQAVYNPYSIISALHAQEINNFWVMSGRHAVLIEALRYSRRFFNDTDITAKSITLNIFDRKSESPVPIMFHSGYLTIVSYDEQKNIYKLDYPNQEVHDSIYEYLLEAYTSIDVATAQDIGSQMNKLLSNGTVKDTLSFIKTIFARVPFFIDDPQEKNYHAILTTAFFVGGLITDAELVTDKGRIDTVLQCGEYIYIIEVKLNATAQKALEQIKERRYYERYMHQGKKIVLWGINFVRAPGIFDIEYAVQEL